MVHSLCQTWAAASPRSCQAALRSAHQSFLLRQTGKCHCKSCKIIPDGNAGDQENALQNVAPPRAGGSPGAERYAGGRGMTGVAQRGTVRSTGPSTAAFICSKHATQRTHPELLVLGRKTKPNKKRKKKGKNRKSRASLG